MGDLHLVLSALNLSTLNARILIMMKQVRLMIFLLNMVDHVTTTIERALSRQISAQAHCNALVVTDLFKPGVLHGHTEVKVVLQKCQSVAVFIHRSENNENTLVGACETTETDYLLPVLAVKS